MELFFFGGGRILGGSLTPFFFCENLLVRVKLGHHPNFNFLGKHLLGEKNVHGKKKKKVRKMPSLVATTSALARTTCMRTHYVHTNLGNLFSVCGTSSAHPEIPWVCNHSLLDNLKSLSISI